MRKKIFINGRFLTQSVTGVQRYAIEMLKALDNLLENGIFIDKARFTVVVPSNTMIKIKLKHISVKKIGFLKGHLWEQIELPLFVRGELLINLCNTAPILKRNQTVTIHDASFFAFPKSYSFSFRYWYKILSIIVGQNSKLVITDSDFSKSELSKYAKIRREKICVIGLGYEHIYATEADISVLKKHGINQSYILAVSSMNPSKNFSRLIQAIAHLKEVEIDIVIAGGTNPKVFKDQSDKLSENVKYIGFVNDSELRALYENARCFVYPSLYEGFGLPPLEAMACGCPVIVSNLASLPEVCGEAGYYCDPYSSIDIANKIVEIINSELLSENIKKKGFDHIKKYSWEKCAFETMSIILKI